ncbi:MAG: hypothetical protein ABR577_19030 [Pyrinomonadaceae bacterium]
MKQRVKTLVLLTALSAMASVMYAARPATLAKPAFMDRYNRDPYSKPELHGKCSVCHINHPGGERNDFGEAFEDAGFRITPQMRAKFSELFESKPRDMENLDTPQQP